VADPDARHAHKTVHRRQDGFKAHIAIEPDTGLVTDCQLTKAAGPTSGDATVGPTLPAANRVRCRSLLIPPTVPVMPALSLAGAGHTSVDQTDPAALGGARRVHPR